MSALLSLIPGEIWAAGAAALAVLFAFWRAYATGRKAGRDAAKVDSYEQDLKALDRANTARADSLRKSAAGGLLDDDGFRRD